MHPFILNNDYIMILIIKFKGKRVKPSQNNERLLLKKLLLKIQICNFIFLHSEKRPDKVSGL